MRQPANVQTINKTITASFKRDLMIIQLGDISKATAIPYTILRQYYFKLNEECTVDMRHSTMVTNGQHETLFYR